MDFKDQIKLNGERVLKLKEQIQTEEATKNAFIMPFLQSLGYDVFNPIEVVPEYVTDIGTKKGEKIDYAIFKDGNPIIIIECKHWSQNLNLHDGQLLRYFHVSKSKFGILTNGIIYRFYSDLEEPNKMDEKPFLEFNIAEIKDNQIEELKKFHKSYFDIESIVNTASELKYSNSISQKLLEEINSPSEAFVKFFVSQVYQGRATANILEQFKSIVHKSINQLINDIINDRLKAALEKNSHINQDIKLLKEDTVENLKENKIITTTEEMEGYIIVKSILRKKIESNRIFFRDFQNFFSILIDDSIRQTICRLYFDSKKKQISFFESKKETKYEIENLDDIFNYEEQILNSIENIEK